MILYIVRHAIAVPRGAPGIAEDDRPLTKEGIDKMQESGAGLKILGAVPEIILSSPLLRAKQTAEILKEAFGKKTPLILIQALEPGGSRSEVYREIRERQEAGRLMLVGHQPSLGEIAGEIAWGSAEHYLELKKGGACALEIERIGDVPEGTLLWLLTPALLRATAG